MITLQSFPQGDTQSKYFAVNNPILYTFLMSGKGSGAFNVYTYIAAAVGFGVGEKFMQIANDVSNVIRPGDVVLLPQGQIRNIISVLFTPNANTLIELDESVMFGTDVQVKSLNNYRAEFRVFHGRKEIDGIGNLVMKQVGVNISGTSDNQGTVKLNVQPYLKIFIELDNYINRSKINTVDRGLWGRFLVQYRERYDGDEKGVEDGWTPSTITLPNMRWYISAVKQIKTFGATSMIPYVRTGSLVGGLVRINFATAFAEPEYYVGYPNEISFIWPEVAGHEFLKLRQQKLTPAKTIAATINTTLLTEGRQEVNRLRLDEYTDPGFVRVSLVEDTEPSEAYVQDGYVLIGYVELI